MEINLCFTTCLSIVIQQLAEFKKHFYVVNQESVANQLYFYSSSVWLHSNIYSTSMKYLFWIEVVQNPRGICTVVCAFDRIETNKYAIVVGR